MTVMQLQGTAIAIGEIADRLGPTAQSEAAVTSLDSLVDGLIVSMGDEWKLRWFGNGER